MSSQYILTLTAMPSHVASSQHYEVPGDSWGMAIIVLLACWVCWFKCKCLRPRNCSEREWREEASWGMQSQNTSEVIVKCVSAIVELQATALETPVSSSAFEDDAGDACGVNSSAQEWQLVCLPEGQLSLATMPAAYSYSVPSLPHAAPAMASDIVRYVEFVPGDNGQHFFNNVPLQRHLGLFRCGGHWRVASRQVDVAQAGGRAHHIDIRKDARHPGGDEVVREKRVGMVCHEPSHERLSHQSTVPPAANHSGLT